MTSKLKTLLIVLLSIQAVVVFAFAISSCKRPPLVDNMKNVPHWAVKIAQMIPFFVEGVRFVDVNSYQSNQEYREAVDIQVIFNNSPAILITSFQDIEYLALIDGDPTYYIFVAKSDLSDKGNILNENGWSSEEYMGKTFWQKENEPKVIIESNHLIVGYGLNIMGTILTLTGNQQSLAVDSQFGQIMSKLPGNWLLSIFQRDAIFNNQSSGSSKVIIGDVFTRDTRMQRMIAATSEDIKNAESYIQEAANQLRNNQDWGNIMISNEGNYWKVSATRMP